MKSQHIKILITIILLIINIYLYTIEKFKSEILRCNSVLSEDDAKQLVESYLIERDIIDSEDIFGSLISSKNVFQQNYWYCSTFFLMKDGGRMQAKLIIRGNDGAIFDIKVEELTMK